MNLLVATIGYNHMAFSKNQLLACPSILQVNDADVTNMTHTDAVNLLRAAPKTVRLVIGRILELPRMPVFPHLLPDITVTCHGEELGKKKRQVWSVRLPRII